MKYLNNLFKITSFVIYLNMVLTTPVMASYLDPGTGSMIIQMSLAVLFGSLFFIKTTWRRVKVYFSGLKENPENSIDEKQ